MSWDKGSRAYYTVPVNDYWGFGKRIQFKDFESNKASKEFCRILEGVRRFRLLYHIKLLQNKRLEFRKNV